MSKDIKKLYLICSVIFAVLLAAIVADKFGGKIAVALIFAALAALTLLGIRKRASRSVHKIEVLLLNILIGVIFVIAIQFSGLFFSFYENPYFHPWDFFVSMQPGVSIATIKNATPLDDHTFEMTNIDHVVPTLRFSAGVEWFIFSNFAVFAEAAYTQHLMPTLIEQAAINKGDIKHPSGPINISVGLSLFFN